MGQMEFDKAAVEQLERVYGSRDVLRRRALVHEALGAQPGDRVLDVGCGPGFFVKEILETVGPEGGVVGVDLSPDMLAAAAARSQGYDNVEFVQSPAAPLPVEDGSVDRALTVQVLEYVDDVPEALRELHRTLRPGGRVVVWDVDWATLSWHSTNPQRMRRVLDAWDQHVRHVSLPRTLSSQLRGAGFGDVVMQGQVFATNELDPETYGGYLVPLIGNHVAESGLVSTDEVNGWADEQYALAERGGFYFAVTQFCFSASA